MAYTTLGNGFQGLNGLFSTPSISSSSQTSSPSTTSGQLAPKPAPFVPPNTSNVTAANFNSSGMIPSVGTKAKNPASNITPASNTLPAGQNAPVAQASYSGGQAVTTPTAPITPGASNGTPASGNNNSVMTPGGSFTTAGTTQTNIPASQTVGSNGVIGGNNGLWGSTVTNLANTAPSSGVTTAQTNLNNQATGNNPAQTNIDTLTGIGQNQTPAVTGAYDALANFNQADPLTKSAQANLPMAALISSGRGQILGNQLAGVQQGLANTYNAAVTGEGQQVSAANAAGGQQLTGQQQQITAANNAGNLANTAQSNQISGQLGAQGATQPVSTPYNAPLTSPQTGTAVNGGGTNSLPADGQALVTSLASQVQSGSMTRADAESRLGAYGVAGISALNTALGSNFNTNASNASAQTTGVGQQIQTAATATNAALDTLGSLFSKLPNIETGGIPATDMVANWIGSALGQAGLAQYNTALNDARSQLLGVLNASGGTPTGNEAMTLQYLPNNMTVGQFSSLVGTSQNPGTARQLVSQKVNAFTSSGNQTNSPSTSGAPQEGQTFAGGSIIYQNGQYVPAQ